MAVRYDSSNKQVNKMSIYTLICVFSIFMIIPVQSVHLKGSWDSKNFFKFMAKFGFQQTNDHDKVNTQGYIFGNITSRSNVTHSMTFVVVDSEYFLEFYGNRHVASKEKACPAMFQKMDNIAWDSTCNPNGKEDFIRKIPCPAGQLCADEYVKWVIPGYQFTYRVQDTKQPRFWYISMVACFHDYSQRNRTSCFWMHDLEDIVLDYDIWLVNGDPSTKHINPFEHQFSFEMHDVFEIYLAFFIVYSFIVPIQLYALTKQKHMLPLILTVCMTMEFIGIIFNFVHVFIFAFNGDGLELLRVVGNFIDNVAQCLFMLLLLLIVKGWTITRMDLPWKARVILFTVWATYTVANMALFIWNLVEVDVISDIDEWQTWPGYLILGFRICIMVWFLMEMRETFLIERMPEKHRFYLHFGAGFLVWFVYLPIIALICTQISALWRYKTILSVTNAADFLSYCVMIHLLWPSRSYLYFNLKIEARIPMDDFEFSDMGKDSFSSSEESLELFETARLVRPKPQHSKSSARLKREQFAASLQSSEEDVLQSVPTEQTPSKILNGHCNNTQHSIDTAVTSFIVENRSQTSDNMQQNQRTNVLENTIDVENANSTQFDFLTDANDLEERTVYLNHSGLNVLPYLDGATGGATGDLQVLPSQSSDAVPGSKLPPPDQFLDINGILFDERHIESTLI